MLAIGFILLLHSAFSLSKFIRYKKLLNEDYYIPKDIMFELIVSFLITIFHLFKKLKNLKSLNSTDERQTFESTFTGIKKVYSNKDKLVKLIMSKNYGNKLDDFFKKIN